MACGGSDISVVTSTHELEQAKALIDARNQKLPPKQRHSAVIVSKYMRTPLLWNNSNAWLYCVLLVRCCGNKNKTEQRTNKKRKRLSLFFYV